MKLQSDPQARWYCVKTQPKREQIAAQHLRRLDGVEVFAPRLRYRKSTARGRIWWIEPLFPGYVLVNMKLEEMRSRVNHCSGVSGLVRFGREVPAVPDQLVESLQREVALQGDHETISSVPVIEIGDEVRVANGPLKGMSGYVVEIIPSLERAGILLEFLGQPRAIELDFLSLVLPRKPLALPATN